MGVFKYLDHPVVTQLRKGVLLTLFLLLASCGSGVEGNFCPGIVCNSTTTATTPATTPVSYSTLFLDDFNRANQSLINADWNVFGPGSSTITVDTNRAEGDTNGFGTPNAIYTTLITDEHTRVSHSFTTGANFGLSVTQGTIGIYARASAIIFPNDFYFCGIHENEAGSHELFFFPLVAGIVGTTARGDTVPLANGDEYNLVFTLNGSNLTCAIEQIAGGSFSSSVSVSDSSHSSGYYGFTHGKNGAANKEVTIDDFLIEIPD